jgi:hypothetical protein
MKTTVTVSVILEIEHENEFDDLDLETIKNEVGTALFYSNQDISLLDDLEGEVTSIRTELARF